MFSCPQCNRYLKAGSTECPFCNASVVPEASAPAVAAGLSRLSRAAVYTLRAAAVAAPAALMGCEVAASDGDSATGGTEAAGGFVAVYGAPFPTGGDAGTGGAATGGDASTGGDNMGGAPVAVYGAPFPGGAAGSSGEEPPTDGGAPIAIYGGPFPDTQGAKL